MIRILKDIWETLITKNIDASDTESTIKHMLKSDYDVRDVIFNYDEKSISFSFDMEEITL